MTASTRFWKRYNSSTSAPVTLTWSLTTAPPVAEPIQLRLRADDDGPQSGQHFVITMSVKEAESLALVLDNYVAKMRLG